MEPWLRLSVATAAAVEPSVATCLPVATKGPGLTNANNAGRRVGLTRQCAQRAIWCRQDRERIRSLEVVGPWDVFVRIWPNMVCGRTNAYLAITATSGDVRSNPAVGRRNEVLQHGERC
jgi:hypothetical protein